ncbi:MAG TPA: hypothetical protein VL993_12155 [Stellaceae bacterium]|nr:hypothetical protein [Stellaceae bacterium]
MRRVITLALLIGGAVPALVGCDGPGPHYAAYPFRNYGGFSSGANCGQARDCPGSAGAPYPIQSNY